MIKWDVLSRPYGVLASLSRYGAGNPPRATVTARADKASRYCDRDVYHWLAAEYGGEWRLAVKWWAESEGDRVSEWVRR